MSVFAKWFLIKHWQSAGECWKQFLGEVKFDPACGDGMKLVEALQLSNQAQVAFTGSGGKTTALFRLGHELTAPVFLTTTTHLGLEQVSYADQHMVIQN